MKERKPPTFYAYMVQCADSTIYTGWTTDLTKRMAAHNSGKGARYTRARRPVELLVSWSFDTKREAMQREYQLKLLRRSEKLQLIALVN